MSSDAEKLFATDQHPELGRMDEIYREEIDKVVKEKGDDNVSFDDTVLAGQRALERLKQEMEVVSDD